MARWLLGAAGRSSGAWSGSRVWVRWLSWDYLLFLSPCLSVPVWADSGGTAARLPIVVLWCTAAHQLASAGFQHGITFGRACTLSDLGGLSGGAGPLPDGIIRSRPAHYPPSAYDQSQAHAPVDGLPVGPRPLTPTSPHLNSRPRRAQGLLAAELVSQQW